MTDLESILRAFSDATGCHAHVWIASQGQVPRLESSTFSRESSATISTLPNDPPQTLSTAEGRVLIASVPGPRAAWVGVGPGSLPESSLQNYIPFLLQVVAQQLQASLEVEHAANELAERYEEINLLYTITEILGRSVSLDETAATILREVCETVGARRGSILVHDRVTDTLQAVATLGVSADAVAPVSASDDGSVSAAVFRDQRAMITDGGVQPASAESSFKSGAMLSVPIMWTSPGGGSEPLGVVNLSDRRSGQPFSAGDQKLVSAIATQIGTAIQNSRLVRESLNQQKMIQELALAQDLQMKLLPRPEIVAPEAQVAARVIPAESVGGDFYNLFRLGRNVTGIMIGDVSGHGYRAALIMALAMSASAIHAEASRDPGETLAALLDTLRDELASTEMFISTFYGVVDREAGLLRYANAGHPHAYLVSGGGTAERLVPTDPALGMVDWPPTVVTRPWHRENDVLLLFTDGVSDAIDRFGNRLGEKRVTDAVCAHRTESPRIMLESVFSELAEHARDTAQPDDRAVVILRS